MDYLKEAFSKIKKDVDFLNNEINSVREELVKTREELIKVCEVVLNLDKKMVQSQKSRKEPSPAIQHINQTTPTHNPTHQQSFKALKSPNNVFSNGNQGVPTDKQTDRQTDTKEEKKLFLKENNMQNPLNFNQNIKETPLKSSQNMEKMAKTENFSYLDENPIDGAAKILDSLDSIKKEIRLKFKRLTNQEMLVFSTLYQLEEESGDVDYKILAKRISLTESSVRDYVGRLIKKGIPVEKKRINNKTILLSISSNLKRISSLSTIIQLRDL